MYNGYRVFPGGKKRPGLDADPSSPSSAEVKRQSRAIPLLSLRAFVAYGRVKPNVKDIPPMAAEIGLKCTLLFK